MGIDEAENGPPERRKCQGNANQAALIAALAGESLNALVTALRGLLHGDPATAWHVRKKSGQNKPENDMYNLQDIW
jgi:hypothetical protein